MIKRSLDLDAVRAFVHIAQLESFTKAADAMETTQAAVSLKLKRLEGRLNCRLVERTPRHVQLTAQGSSFLDHARKLLQSHDQALSFSFESRDRLSLGVSDHVAGPDFPSLIARVGEQYPKTLIETRIGSSVELLQCYDRREFDAVIVRFDAGRDDGTVLSHDIFGWYAAEGWRHVPGEPLPLAIMPEPCGVRMIAQKALEEAEVPWREVFLGGGVTAVSSAVLAKLGVAALARRMLPLGAVEVGAKMGLPPLPSLPIVLHSRVRQEQSQRIIADLSAAFSNAT